MIRLLAPISSDLMNIIWPSRCLSVNEVVLDGQSYAAVYFETEAEAITQEEWETIVSESAGIV